MGESSLGGIDAFMFSLKRCICRKKPKSNPQEEKERKLWNHVSSWQFLIETANGLTSQGKRATGAEVATEGENGGDAR